MGASLLIEPSTGVMSGDTGSTCGCVSDASVGSATMRPVQSLGLPLPDMIARGFRSEEGRLRIRIVAVREGTGGQNSYGDV